MTAGQRQAASGWVASAKEWAPIITVVIAVIYFGKEGITALVGPIKVGTQVELTSIAGRVSALEEAQKAFVTSQAATVDEIRSTKAAILDKINSMPRLTDFSDQSAHLSRLDERMNKVESAAATLSAQVAGLDTRESNIEVHQPYRNPPGRQ